VIGLTDSFRPVHDRRGLYAPNAGGKGNGPIKAPPALRIVAGAR
jgi:hypothetical protein